MYRQSGNRIAALVLLLWSFFPTVHAQESSRPEVEDLTCEYLVNPIGIDALHPRLSWRLKDARQGAKQLAYKIIVGIDSTSIVKGIGAEWQFGKTISGTNLISYNGKELKPFQRYFWSVSIWDKDGKQLNSRVSSFEMGMINSANWQGTWISDENGIVVKPAPYFRKVFKTNKKIRSARVYIAAAGLYELSLNGKRVGDHQLDPMYTRFDRRTLYVTYDVTNSVSQGENTIGVLLGNGWYNHQSTAVWDFDKAPWRARPTFCLDLRVIYQDGSIETVRTNENWKTSLSPVTFNSIYTAEHYDGRLEQEGWNTIAFNDSAWKNSTLRSAPSQNIVAQELHPIRHVERIEAVSMKKLNDTTLVFDLGRNISGVSEIKLKGLRGTLLRLKHGERLKPDGHVDQSNIDIHYRPTDDTDPYQTDIFILSGKGEEQFSAKFNYKGFQYVQVNSDRPIDLTQESLVGYFMHSDVPAIGRIQSSNSTINKIWKATNNSYLSNLFGYPTDCPQREKNGWTGDSHIALETGLYSFDAITVYEKWLADHRDEQQPNGVLPSIIPTGGWGYEWGNGPDWTSTIGIIPWTLYQFYGDSKPMADCYENLKRYVDHINSLYPSGLTTWGLGDWVPVKSKAPVELTSSAYYFNDVRILAKAAKLFGKKQDMFTYEALANKIKIAFNKKYLNEQTGVYDTGLQTELSVPLFWELVPDALKSKTASNLAARVAADSFHLDVGILGAKAILNALSDNGYAEIAYKIAAQETFPSWGWWIVNGATTLYENWNIDAKYDISLNHIMFGEIGAWLYKGPAGIHPDENAPGFKNILLEPHFIEELDHFDAEHGGPYGMIQTSWKRLGSGIGYMVTIPCNSTASVWLPFKEKQVITINGKLVPGIRQQSKILYKINAGTYFFEVK